MSVVEAFGELADVLARMDPTKISTLQAPEAMGERVAILVQKKKEALLNEEEAVELERYLSLDLLITLAKARAYHFLAA